MGRYTTFIGTTVPIIMEATMADATVDMDMVGFVKELLLRLDRSMSLLSQSMPIRQSQIMATAYNPAMPFSPDLATVSNPVMAMDRAAKAVQDSD